MKLRDFHLTLRGWFRYRRVGRRIERCMDEFSDALMQWAWRFMGLIYGEFPETAARLILSAALRKLPQLAKRLFPGRCFPPVAVMRAEIGGGGTFGIDERFALAAWMSKPAPFFRV